MCGIWGHEGQPNTDIIRRVAEAADERGGHGYGYYGIGRKGNHVYFVAQGRADIQKLVDLAQHCVVGIGHSRLITSGDWQLMNSQPVLGDGIAVVHNGNIKKHHQIHWKYGYKPRTTLDSEAVIPMIKNPPHVPSGAVLAILFDKYNHRLLSYSDDLPLVSKKVRNETYYCSKKWEGIERY